MLWIYCLYFDYFLISNHKPLCIKIPKNRYRYTKTDLCGQVVEIYLGHIWKHDKTNLCCDLTFLTLGEIPFSTLHHLNMDSTHSTQSFNPLRLNGCVPLEVFLYGRHFQPFDFSFVASLSESIMFFMLLLWKPDTS